MLGKQDTLDRTVQALIALIALFALAFGTFMLWDPYVWYLAVPTVRFTGPPNSHFIRFTMSAIDPIRVVQRRLVVS